MIKIENNNRILSEYVLKYLVNNNIVKEGSTLDNLHLVNEDMGNYESAKQFKDTHKYNYTSGINEVQKYLYNLDDDKKWRGLYMDLLKQIYDNVDYDFYFQNTPQIRVHCPNVNGAEHYPMYHSDIILGHPPQEINVWLSLTNNNNTGFFILEFDDSVDYFKKYSNDELLNMALNDKKGYNEDCHKLAIEVESRTDCVFLFDSYRIHSGMPRKDDTRVSMDIRINPVKLFKHGYVGTGVQKAEFWPGGKFGYNEKSIKELL